MSLVTTQLYSVTILHIFILTGMMRSVRKNFFNIVIICNPAKATSKPLLKMLEAFYLQRAPTRVGIVFAVPSDLEAYHGKNDAGVAFLKAYNYITESSTRKNIHLLL